MSPVSFQNADTKPVLKGKVKLGMFIVELFLENKLLLESLTIIFCSDDYLFNLNRQFLNHDYYTDILTFDLSTDQPKIGEIYISVDRIKENSVMENITFHNELLRVIFHGVLHLCGFGDKTAYQKKKMTKKENDALLKFASFHVKQ